MPRDADFIVLVSGREVTEYCEGWDFRHETDEKSGLTIVLANPDYRLRGLVSMADSMAIRFGVEGDMSGKAQFNVKDIRRGYPTGKPSITVRGYDDRDKLGGGKSRGNFRKGTTPKQIVEDICKAHGLKPSVKMKDLVLPEDVTLGVYNETDEDIIYRMLKMCEPENVLSDNAPASFLESASGKPDSFKGQSYNDGNLHSGAGPQLFGPDEGTKCDRNQASNNAHQAAAEPVTARLRLMNYPWLMPDTTVMVLGEALDPDDAGTYYAKGVHHSWRIGGPIWTKGKLTRGGTGKGGAGGKPPLMIFADPYKKGSIHIGPRNYGGAPVHTFVIGDGGVVKNFTVHQKTQSHRGGGENGGKAHIAGINDRKKGKAYKESASGGQQ